MKKGVCPKCGSKKLEEKLPVQSGLPFTMLYRGMMKDWVKVEATVCKECGYCELYVTEKHMNYLKEETKEEIVEIKKDVEAKKRKAEQGKTCYNCKYYLNEDNVWCNSVKRWKNEYQECENWTEERI
jgi:predicted nucleic-acid-binding Zn-ribbon protein